jgi:hypothetical protein
VTVVDIARWWMRAAIGPVTLAAIVLLLTETAHAQSYPLCGGRPGGTVCQTPTCGSVSAGTECLLPLCGTLPPGTPLGAPCIFGEFLPACGSVSTDTPCRPTSEIDCGLVPPGYPCFGNSLPAPPACSPTLPVDTWCNNAEGNGCRVVSTGQYACVVDQGQTQCVGSGQIVQDCIAGTGPGGSPLFRKLTDDAVAGVLRDHQLPQSDASLVMGFARDSVRAYLFAELLNVIVKASRSPEEDAIVAFYTQNVQALRVRQAQRSEDEYAKFAANPCGYVPPPGFTWPIPPNCARGSLATLFANLSHPTMTEFIAYGVDGVVQEEIAADLEAFHIAANMSAAVHFGAAVAIATGLAVGAFLLVTAATSVGVAVAATLAPHCIVALGVVGAVASGAAAVAAVVFAIVLFIVGTVTISVNYNDYDKFVEDVTTLTERLAVVDLRTAIETKRGMADLFHVYVKSTQPDWPSDNAPPAPAFGDPLFSVRDAGGAHVALTPTIHLATAPWGQGRVLTYSTSLHGGWFRTTTAAVDPYGLQKQTTSLSLGITFVDWDGKVGTAWRRDSQFVLVYTDAEGNALAPIVADELKFVDPGGGQSVASIVHRFDARPSPPRRAAPSLQDETR